MQLTFHVFFASCAFSAPRSWFDGLSPLVLYSFPPPWPWRNWARLAPRRTPRSFEGDCRGLGWWSTTSNAEATTFTTTVGWEFLGFEPKNGTVWVFGNYPPSRMPMESQMKEFRLGFPSLKMGIIKSWWWRLHPGGGGGSSSHGRAWA